MAELLHYVESLSWISVLVVSVIVVGALRFMRRWTREDLGLKKDETLGDKIRSVLGLKEEETLGSKMNEAVQQGFESSVHPITVALRDLSQEITTLQAKMAAEVAGVREATTDHGRRLQLVEMQVAALTGQVGGLPAVHALRARLERKKAAAATRVFNSQSEEKPK